MNELIVESARPVTLVGGGQATPQCLHEALILAPLCVAVDSGARLVLSERIELAALIGDFDSVDGADLARIPEDRQHCIAEQETTDFEKALMRIAAPVVLGVGFLGGRLDHQLAALNGLLTFPHRPCILVGLNEIVFLLPPAIDLPTQAGDTVSLFPLARARGRGTGLTWPIDDLTLRPGGRVGTSNAATGPVRLEMESPSLLAILPRRLMQPVVDLFAAPDAARWPAPPG
ncbi:MAG: thiamine diphosphokinase [Sulfitobacter sp.]|nr:thiamine diphosphokinase [Sulfitobacter sp.]